MPSGPGRMLKWADVKRSLTMERRGRSVVVHYLERQPVDCGAGSIHGVRTAQCVDTYVRALDWAHRRLTTPPIDLPTGHLPVDVYCSEIPSWSLYADPITFDETGPGGVKRPVIALPGRTLLPDLRLARQFQVSAAVHEMAHAVCAQLPGMRSVQALSTGRWWWLAEATAVWLETLLSDDDVAREAELPATLDWLRFAADWSDFPEAPVHDELAAYHAAPQFLRYLVSGYGEQIVGELWRRGNVDKDPWPLIEALTSLSPDDLFSDFAGHAYLMNEESSRCHFPEIFQRFGGRLVTNTLMLRPSQSLPITGSVWPMACRYYSIRSKGAQEAQVVWDGVGDLRLVIGTATSTGKRADYPTTTLTCAGTTAVPFAGTDSHVWIAACGQAGKPETTFSFEVRGR